MSIHDAFVHLQVHSEFSLLDGAIKIPRLIATCEQANATAIALTDKGNLFGAIDFYFEAKSKGIRPIIGCELTIVDDMTSKDRSKHRLIFLCQNRTGYENLCAIVSAAHIHGFYYQPRVDQGALAGRTDGLICISPGYWGPVSQRLQEHFVDQAKAVATQLSTLFPDRFYLGIQRTGELGMDQLAQDIIEFSAHSGHPLVALNDVYFIQSDEGWMQHMLHCIQMGRQIDQDDEQQARLSQHFLKSPDDMVALFSDVPDAVSNTVVIANQCQVELASDQVLLPRFDCPNNQSPEEYLSTLVWVGIQKKYDNITPEITDRVNHELSVINTMQYPIYFLIIYDFLVFCDREQIPVGPGRGSAAGSIVAYALNITRIDPIRYRLLFERFLNPDRVTMPDIDIDFCIKRRNDVIDYISKKYGRDHVAQIATFGTMAARGVIRDVGRALGLPLDFVDRVAKCIPAIPGQSVSIRDTLDAVGELATLYERDNQTRQLLDYGMSLEGFVRHASTHAAGLVISRDPLTTMVPLMDNSGQITTHYTMTNLDALGLLKMDILGLRNLTVIRDVCDRIVVPNRPFNIDEIPLDDALTYDQLSLGDSVGIFQCESPGMQRLIIDLKPNCFEDIIALLALYRPGPLGSGMVNEFISNKSGKTTAQYLMPELEPILSDTYGIILYQEQVMQIAHVVAGFTLAQSDMLRRAMGKKKKDVMDQMRDTFLNGAREHAVDDAIAHTIFDLCCKFAEYGFNKSHSAAYALISYQTAYLKTHYPREYMLGLLVSVLGNTDRTAVYLKEVKRLGIPILPPDVNHSHYDHTLGDDGIRIGLGGIKGIGESPVAAIVTHRETGLYQSVYDFFNRIKGCDVNKRVVEHLIRAGAFDGLDTNRTKLLACYEEILDKLTSSMRHQLVGQMGLFDTLDDDFYTDLIASASYTQRSLLPILRDERELMGGYISGHPLDDFVSDWEQGESIANIDESYHQSVVTVVGILSNVEHRRTKGNRPFTRANLDDFGRGITVLLFDSSDYATMMAKINDDTVVRLSAKVKASQSDTTLIIESLDVLSHDLTVGICHIDVDAPSVTQLNEIRQVCLTHSGHIPLYFHTQQMVVAANKKYWVNDTALRALMSIVGDQRVWMEH